MRLVLLYLICIFSTFVFSQPKQAPWWKAIRFTRIPMEDTITVRVPCVTVDANNVIWTGRGRWLCGWDDNKKTWEYHNIKDSIAALAIDNKGRFWIGTESHTILLFDKITRKKMQVPLKDFKGNTHINKICFTNDNSVWVCTSDGLCKVRESYGELKVELIHDLKGMEIKDFEDHKGLLKVATQQGVYQSTGSGWSPILYYDKKNIWAMDNNGGDELFLSYNVGRVDYVYRNNLKLGADSAKRYQFNDVLADDYGRMWGAVKGGVYGWSEAFGGWHYFNNINSELNVTESWVIIQDKKGDIWVGAEEGLYKILSPTPKTETATVIPENPNTPPNTKLNTYNENAVLSAGTAPIHLVLVLDISGSMESSITRMGIAFNNILRNLRAEDKISIVAYASKAETKAESLSIDAAAKKEIRDIFSSFKYKGGTNIKAALAKAAVLAKAHKVPEGNNRVIIVSDANFDVESRYPAVAEMAGNGIKTTIFCSQKKTKDQHKALEEFAKRGNGTYFNFAIENSATIEQAFWEELTQ